MTSTIPQPPDPEIHPPLSIALSILDRTQASYCQAAVPTAGELFLSALLTGMKGRMIDTATTDTEEIATFAGDVDHRHQTHAYFDSDELVQLIGQAEVQAEIGGAR